MVFHWSLSDSKSPQVSRTLFSILADIKIVIVWMVPTWPLYNYYHYYYYYYYIKYFIQICYSHIFLVVLQKFVHGSIRSVNIHFGIITLVFFLFVFFFLLISIIDSHAVMKYRTLKQFMIFRLNKWILWWNSYLKNTRSVQEKKRRINREKGYEGSFFLISFYFICFVFVFCFCFLLLFL